MIRHVLNTLGSFRTALAVGVGLPFLMAASAFAQDPPIAAQPSVPNAPVQAAGGGEATTDRVIVTGSYIPTAETESALPVTVYTAEVLQKQGATTPVEGLRQLPSFVGNAATENDSNGGNGTASINLRAVGSVNTLILLNGRRTFNFNDINAIPIGALARTEILKDGASAIYGSDAVAGVVNFVLLNGPGEAPYQGAELFALYGNTTEKDAHVRQFFVKGGATGMDGKFSVAAAGEYYSRANLFSRDRTIAVSGDKSNNPTGLGLGGLNTNSPTYGGRVTVAGSGSTVGLATGPRQLINRSMGGTILPSDYRQFDAGGAATDPSRFNFREFTPAIPAVEKAMYFATAKYKIFGDGLQIYGDVMYSKTKQDNGLAAAPFGVPGTIVDDAGVRRASSPYSPFGRYLSNVLYRTVRELGLRKTFNDSDYQRFVVAFNGDFNFKDNSFISRFGYDTGFVYEHYQQQSIDSGDARFTPLFDEIQAGNFNPFIGVGADPVGTAATFTTDPVTGASVPTGFTQDYDNTAAAQRASYLGHSFFYESDYLYDIKVNMHLFPNLWNGGVDLAAGYEHRNIRQHSVPDPVQAEGDQLGFNQAPNTKTTQEVDSFFTELIVPFVTSTMNVPFVRSFELSIAWRYEKFKDRDNYTKLTGEFDNVNDDEDFGGTPRVSLRYQPIADLTLRASWGQSFRSPTPSSLFDPVSQNFPVLFDPVISETLQPPEGVWQGGNTMIQPEKTDTYSAGMVWTPKFLPGFTMTADWYQIFTTDLILSPVDNAQVLLSTGVVDPDGFGNGSNTIDGPGGPADGVTRNEFGNVQAVDADFGNAGKRLIQGIDITAVYEIPTQNWGTFTISGGWNHFFTWKAQANEAIGYHNFLGDYNNGTFPLAPGAIPFNKAFLRGEWAWKGFDFISTINYIGDYEDDPNAVFGNALIPGSPGSLVDPADPSGPRFPPSANPEFVLHRRVSDYITLDMQLSYEWKKPELEAAATGYSKDAKDAKSALSKEVAGVESSTIWQRMLWNTRVTVGVNNAFDRQPPSVLGAFNDNYDTSLYSIRNRYYYVSMSKKF